MMASSGTSVRCYCVFLVFDVKLDTGRGDHVVPDHDELLHQFADVVGCRDLRVRTMGNQGGEELPQLPDHPHSEQVLVLGEQLANLIDRSHVLGCSELTATPRDVVRLRNDLSDQLDLSSSQKAAKLGLADARWGLLSSLLEDRLEASEPVLSLRSALLLNPALNAGQVDDAGDCRLPLVTPGGRVALLHLLREMARDAPDDHVGHLSFPHRVLEGAPHGFGRGGRSTVRRHRTADGPLPYLEIVLPHRPAIPPPPQVSGPMHSPH
jgi:hypothetical protein